MAGPGDLGPTWRQGWPTTVEDMTQEITAWLSDMDGVLVHEGHAIEGAAEFLNGLQEREMPFLVLTNNSIYTPRDLSARLQTSGLNVPEDRIWTSALATATFLAKQSDSRRAFVVGEAGITTALHEEGFVLTEEKPDFVVLGETRTYSFEAITKAVRLILGGARFIATNPDPTGPTKEGPLPATGSVAALIQHATQREPYFVGKPNPVMLRHAMNKIGAHSENTALVGDRMDTDILAGMESGLQTHLVLTGSTHASEIERFPYRPEYVHDSIADIVERL